MSEYSLADFFIHPILQIATLGSMLMGLSSALIGGIVLAERRSLLGEALSHAAYPGIVLAPCLAAFVSFLLPKGLLIVTLCGALLTTYVGVIAMEKCERYLKLTSDTTLALVSSLFLALGVLIASRMQFISPLSYQKVQAFLYGQAATMTGIHLFLYGVLACITSVCIIVYFRHIELVVFDRAFASSVALSRRRVDRLLLTLLVFIVVLGIRSAGVVLMSGMLLAPAIAARQLTDRLSKLLILSGCFGALSAFLGNVLAIYFPLWLGKSYALPTGPMIVLVAAFFCLATLLVAPKRGVLFRLLRMAQFRLNCLSENILKTLWKGGANEKMLTLEEVVSKGMYSPFLAYYGLFQLRRRGWVKVKKEGYCLTEAGSRKATQLVRLHRLWELYLTSELSMDCDRVHRSAEEMEHILTPALEEKLTCLLGNPTTDPHDQPIPQWEDAPC